MDVTTQLESKCIQVLKECDCVAAAEITGVSWERLSGIIDRAVKRDLQRRGDAVPTVIGLDEKQFFFGPRYFTIVSDPVNHCVFGVITEGRAMKDIKYWFEGREKALKTVETATMDMSASYASPAKKYMPDADI